MYTYIGTSTVVKKCFSFRFSQLSIYRNYFMNTVQYVPTIAPYLVYAWGAFVAQFKIAPTPRHLAKRRDWFLGPVTAVSFRQAQVFCPSAASFLALPNTKLLYYGTTYMHIFCVWFGNRLFAVRTSDSYQDSAGFGSRRLKKLKYLLCCSTLKKLSCLTLDPHGTWIRIFIRQYRSNADPKHWFEVNIKN